MGAGSFAALETDAPAPGAPPRGNLAALIALAAPIAVSQVAQSALGFIDTVMVGRLGAVPLAAVALGVTLHYAMLLFAFGAVLGVGPLASQAHGAGDARDVARYTRQGLWLATLLTPLIMGVEYASPYWLGYLGQDAAVAALAGEYLRAVMWTVWPFLAFAALRAWLEAIGRPEPVTVIAVTAVGVNVVANLALIFGYFGAPALGAVGAGYATAISYTYFFVAGAGYVLSRPGLRAYRVLDRWRAPDPAYLRELLRVGLPMGVSFALEAGFFTATGVLVGTLGANSLAAHQIGLQMVSLSFMLPLAVSMATAVRVGNLVGAARAAAARRSGWLGIVLGVGMMTVSALVYVTFPEVVVALFLGAGEAAAGPDAAAEREAVGAIAVQLLFVAGVFQVFDGAQSVASGALRGLKDTFWPMVIASVSYWVIGLGTGYYLMGAYGAPGLWGGLVAGLVAASTALLWRWRRLSSRI